MNKIIITINNNQYKVDKEKLISKSGFYKALFSTKLHKDDNTEIKNIEGNEVNVKAIEYVITNINSNKNMIDLFDVSIIKKEIGNILTLLLFLDIPYKDIDFENFEMIFRDDDYVKIFTYTDKHHNDIRYHYGIFYQIFYTNNWFLINSFMEKKVGEFKEFEIFYVTQCIKFDILYNLMYYYKDRLSEYEVKVINIILQYRKLGDKLDLSDVKLDIKMKQDIMDNYIHLKKFNTNLNSEGLAKILLLHNNKGDGIDLEFFNIIYEMYEWAVFNE